MNILFGTKQQQSQLFLTDGTRIPVTHVRVAKLPVVQVKTKEKEGYTALQVGLGVGKKKQMSKGLMGHIAKAKIDMLPKRVVEIRIHGDETLPEVGGYVNLQDILKPGDIVKVTGTSKGKGFAGGVKRYHFKGGPRTHGQSDRERAPGSLGQTTTPGRVYKGKRMAGHMGVDTATVTNLLVVAVSEDVVSIKGLLPGVVNANLKIEKTGESKKFVAPLAAGDAEKQAEATDDVAQAKVQKTEEVSEEKAEE
ncbi:MAG: 50S ribosomal protein L3, partial [bacterium]|nr:50S ribosomal protein L3 [bacterium]